MTTPTEQRIREICNSAVSACSLFYTDLSLGGKHLALRILQELDAKEKADSIDNTGKIVSNAK